MAEIGTVKPEQEEEDDYAGYYKWNDVQPIHIQDDSYRDISMPERQKLWDSGFRPDDAAWELNSRHPSDIETNFVMYGSTHSTRFGGTLKPFNKYTAEDKQRESEARKFNMGGRSAPLPRNNKNLNSAQKLMGEIEYAREHMTREDRFGASALVGGALKRMPFTFGVPEMLEAGQEAAALDRIYDGNANSADYASVAWSIVMAEKEEEDDFVVKAFRGASALPAYAIDIAFTGGVSALPKALGKKGANILLKKLGKEKFKKLMRNAVAKQVRKAAPYVIEGATHAGVTRVGETVAEAIPRRDLLFPDPDDPDAPITDEGFVKTEKDSLVNSTMRAFAQQAGGYIVEKLGGKALEKVGKGVKGKTLDPVLDNLRSKIGKPAQKEVMEKGEAFLEKVVKEAWEKDNPMLAQLGEKMGLSGMISELGEERMQELFNGANEYMFSLLPGYARDADSAVRDKLGMFGGNMSRDEILEQLAIEAIGIGALKAGVSSFQADAQTDGILEGMERAKSHPVHRMLIDKGYADQVGQLITEGSTSRKAFTQVKLPDGSTLYDVFNSEQKREQFLREAEQMQIEVDRLEREESEQAEQPVPTQPEAEQPTPSQPEAEQPAPVQPEAEQPVPTQPEPQPQAEQQVEPTQPVQPRKKPWEQSPDEFIQRYGEVKETEQRDSTKLGQEEGDETDVTPTRGFSLPKNTENVSMETSSKGKPFVLKRDTENNLYAVVDGKVAAYAANTEQGVDLDVVDEFRGQGIETKLAEQFYELNPDAPVEGVTSRTSDNLIEDHFNAVEQALKKGEPVPFKVKEIHLAQANVKAAEQRFNDAENPSPQQKGAVTRAKNNLDLVKAKYVDDFKAVEPETLVEPVTPVEPITPIEPETVVQPEAPPVIPETPPVEPAPIPPVPEPSVEAKKQTEDVQRIGRRDIMKAYPGLRVTKMEDGNYQLHLPKAGVVNVLFHQNPTEVFKFKDAELKQFYKDYAGKPGFYENYPTVEDFIATYKERQASGVSPVGGRFRPPKPSEAVLDVLGVIDMNDSAQFHANQNTDQLKTFKHELVHFAHFTGMWEAKELESLVDKYSDRSRTVRQQSEDLARAGELWKDPNLVQRIVDWINKYLAKITNGNVQLTPEAARNVMMSPEFWERQTTRDPSKTIRKDYKPPTDTSLLQMTDADDIDKPGGKKRKPLYDRQADGHAIPGETKEQRIAATIARQQVKSSAAPPLTDQAVRNNVNKMRGKTTTEREKYDNEAIKRWRDPKQAFSVYDQHHLTTLANELIDTGDINDHATAMELYSINVERGAEAARVMRFRRDPVKGPITEAKDKLWEAIFVPNKTVRERMKGIKNADPRKRAVAQKAYIQEKKRLDKVRKYAVKLGYSLGRKGLMKLARNPKHAVMVANYAIDSKKSLGRKGYEIAAEYTVGNMISAMSTQIYNLKANVLFSGYMEFLQANAAILNSLTRNNKDIQYRDYKKALRDTDYKDVIPQLARITQTSAKNAFTRWFEERAVMEEQVGADEHQKFEVAPAIPGKVGRVYRAVATGPMAAIDQFFKTFFTHLDVGVHAAFLARQEAERRAASKHEDNMTEEEITELADELLLDKRSPAWQNAFLEAEQKVFQDDGGELSQKALSHLRGIRRLPFGVGEALTHLSMVFLRTPVRIVGNAMTMFPGTGIIVQAKMIKNWKNGDHILKGVSKEVVSQITTTMLAYMMWGLIPDDEDDEVKMTGATSSLLSPDLENFQYSEGVPGKMQFNPKRILPDAIGDFLQLEDRWYSYDKDDPFSFGFASLYDAMYTFKNTDKKGLEKAVDVASQGALSLGTQMKDKTFFNALYEFGKLIETANGQRYVSHLLTRFIPNIYSDVVRKMRGHVVDAGSEGIVDRFQKISGLKDAPPIRNVWAKKSPVSGWQPWASKSAETFIGDLVYMEYNKQHQDKPKAPVRHSKKFKDEGVEREFNPQEFEQYVVLSGELAVEIVEKLVPEELAKEGSLGMVEVTNSIISESKTIVKDYYKDTESKPQEGFAGFKDRRPFYVNQIMKSVYDKWGEFLMSPKPPRKGEPTKVYEDKVKLWEEKQPAAQKWYDWATKNRDKIFN